MNETNSSRGSLAPTYQPTGRELDLTTNNWLPVFKTNTTTHTTTNTTKTQGQPDPVAQRKPERCGEDSLRRRCGEDARQYIVGRI